VSPAGEKGYIAVQKAPWQEKENRQDLQSRVQLHIQSHDQSRFQMRAACSSCRRTVLCQIVVPPPPPPELQVQTFEKFGEPLFNRTGGVHTVKIQTGKAHVHPL
jgi:hypothetical protein